jgi:hypothetical protein
MRRDTTETDARLWRYLKKKTHSWYIDDDSNILAGQIWAWVVKNYPAADPNPDQMEHFNDVANGRDI